MWGMGIEDYSAEYIYNLHIPMINREVLIKLQIMMTSL